MSHAPITDATREVSRTMQGRPAAFGFDSFDRTWTRQPALEAAAQRRPGPVIAGDRVAGGSPPEVARQAARNSEVPVLAVTGDGLVFERAVPQGAAIDGPCAPNELDAARDFVGARARVVAETHARSECAGRQ